MLNLQAHELRGESHGSQTEGGAEGIERIMTGGYGCQNFGALGAVSRAVNCCRFICLFGRKEFELLWGTGPVHISHQFLRAGAEYGAIAYECMAPDG